jgi:hypothetical protein
MDTFCKEYPYFCEKNVLNEQGYLNLFKSVSAGKIIPHKGIIKNTTIKVKTLPKEKEKKEKLIEKKPMKKLFFRGKPTKATEKIVPEDILVKAKLANASRIFYESGYDVAQDYINENIGENTYIIEPDLSNDIGLVVLDQNDNVSISYKGTDVNNPQELLTDGLSIFGKETNSPEFSVAKSQLENVIESYGKPQELIGFSRGSLFSMHLGNEFKINTTELNPLISPSLLNSQKTGSVHEIFRTKGDPISFLAKGTTKDSKWRVRSIDPLKDTLNPIEEHSLSQLLTNDSPRRSESIDEYIDTNRRNQSKLTAEKINMKNIDSAIREGMSFTEYMEQFNRGDRFTEGRFGARVYKNSNYTRLWQEAGGSFSPKETQVINNAPTGEVIPDQHTLLERISFFNSNDKDLLIQKQIETESNAHELSELFSRDPDLVREQLLTETSLTGISPEISTLLVDALHPVNIGLGIAGGLLAGEEIAGLEKLVKLNKDSEIAATGALGGVNTSILSGALSGGGISLAETGLYGAAGITAGFSQYYSQKAIASALDKTGLNKDAKEVIALTSSSAIGGATAGATSALLSAGAAALTGAEIGTALAPETLGLSILVGAGIGGVVGAGSFVAEKTVDFGKALYQSTQSNTFDPYYVMPNFNSMDMGSTMAFLNRQAASQNLQRSDIAAGITPEQRTQMGMPGLP